MTYYIALQLRLKYLCVILFNEWKTMITATV